MSYNNHDKDDPNAVKYTKDTNLKNLINILNEADNNSIEDDEDFELMQIFLMAKGLK